MSVVFDYMMDMNSNSTDSAAFCKSMMGGGGMVGVKVAASLLSVEDDGNDRRMCALNKHHY